MWRSPEAGAGKGGDEMYEVTEVGLNWEAVRGGREDKGWERSR